MMQTRRGTQLNAKPLAKAQTNNKKNQTLLHTKKTIARPGKKRKATFPDGPMDDEKRSNKRKTSNSKTSEKSENDTVEQSSKPME